MSPKKEKTGASALTVELYEKLIKTHPEIERKGDTIPYTSVNGHMFSLVSKEGAVGIRLPEKEREEFLKKYKTNLIKSYGVVMKEYVSVPDKLLADTKSLKPYLATSYEYVKSLKPKPTTKTKKAK